VFQVLESGLALGGIFRGPGRALNQVKGGLGSVGFGGQILEYAVRDIPRSFIGGNKLNPVFCHTQDIGAFAREPMFIGH
jgi:hypothetical protein